MSQPDIPQAETSELVNLANGIPKGKVPVCIEDGLRVWFVGINEEEKVKRFLFTDKPKEEGQLGYDIRKYEIPFKGAEMIRVCAVQYFKLEDRTPNEGLLIKELDERTGRVLQKYGTGQPPAKDAQTNQGIAIIERLKKRGLEFDQKAKDEPKKATHHKGTSFGFYLARREIRDLLGE